MLRYERVLAFAKLGRPKFLVGGFVLFGLGARLAVVEGATLNWHRYGLGQAFITATQLMTHYSNDYFDLEADRANATPTRWSGGSRILPNGEIPARVALVTALVLALIAALLAIITARSTARQPLVLPLAFAILALSWCYSAPPVRLLSRGLGELTTALVVTLLTPCWGFYLQRGALGSLPALACLPLCGFQFAMLLTIELPDAAGDAALGKRTLVVRRGPAWGAHACVVVVALSFASLPLLVRGGLPRPIAALAALSAPLGAWHCWRLLRGAFRDPARFEGLALCSVLLLVISALGELSGTFIANGAP